MPIAVAVLFYAVGFLCAGLTYGLGSALPGLAAMLFFGLPIVLYLAFEWVVTPGLALMMGFQARWWSIPRAIVVGLPVAVFYTLVTPAVSSHDPSLPVPVPWLALYEQNKAQIGPLIPGRLCAWLALFATSMAIARWSRILREPTGRRP